MRSWAALLTAVAAMSGSTAGTASAQDPGYDLAILNGGAFPNAQGNIAVNATAGANNQQANIAVIAKGNDATGTAALVQFLETTDASADRQMSAHIADGAFANSSGLIAINVSAGNDNQQGNLALLSIAGVGTAAGDLVLSQSRASRDPAANQGPDAINDGTAMVAPGAFENSSGVVQLNIIGGERNSSSNLFALSIQDGGNP